MTRKMKYLMLIGAVALLSLTPAAGASARPLEPNARNSILRSLTEVRRATARFNDVDTAQAEGYAPFLNCVSEPGRGTMGLHFVNGDRVGDATVDVLQPEAVLYEPQRDGRLKLVGVEYVVFASAWHATHSSPPTLLGQRFAYTGSPNRYGLPPFYALHAWVWERNPNGLFADWNPRLACPTARIPRGAE